MHMHSIIFRNVPCGFTHNVTVLPEHSVRFLDIAYAFNMHIKMFTLIYYCSSDHLLLRPVVGS